jgi:hypothetical protein
MTKIEILGKHKENQSEAYKFAYDLPDKWEELDSKQLVAIAPLYMTNGMPEGELLMKIFIALTRMTPNVFKIVVGAAKKDADPQQAFDKIAELLRLVEWTTERAVCEIDIMAHYKGLSGPGDYLSGICWEQLGLADGYLRAWQTDKKRETLIQLLAIVYRKKDYPWNAEDLRPQTQILTLLEMDELMALLINYIALRNKAIDTRPDAFVSDGADDELPRINMGGGFDPEGYFKLAIDMAGPKTGTYKEVLATRADEVLLMLEKTNIDAKRRDEEIQAQRGS